MKLTRFSITSLVAVSITTFSIAAEPAKPSPISFSIDAQWLHSDDYADNTAALAWDFLWSTEQDNLPSFYYRARLHSSGVIAIDSELNRTPLIIEGDAFVSDLGEAAALIHVEVGDDSVESCFERGDGGDDGCLLSRGDRERDAIV